MVFNHPGKYKYIKRFTIFFRVKIIHNLKEEINSSEFYLKLFLQDFTFPYETMNA